MKSQLAERIGLIAALSDKEKKSVLGKAIRRQINMISNAGSDPEWSLFEKTFGWFQMKQNMSEADQTLYQTLWEKELAKLYKKIDTAGLDRKRFFQTQFMLSQANRKHWD